MKEYEKNETNIAVIKLLACTRNALLSFDMVSLCLLSIVCNDRIFFPFDHHHDSI